MTVGKKDFTNDLQIRSRMYGSRLLNRREISGERERERET